MLFIICLLASMSLFYPAVEAAQTRIIYQVNTPSSVLAGTETPLPISVTVYYENAVTGSRLVVGVLDASLSQERIVPGVVVFSTDPCINQPEATALCVIAVEKSSGVVKIAFQIGGIFDRGVQPKTWNLNITSLLINPQNNVIPGSVSSKLFKIDLTQVPSNNGTIPSTNPDTLATLSHLDYTSLVAIALTIITAAIVVVLLAQRTKRSIKGWSGSEMLRYSDTKKACL